MNAKKSLISILIAILLLIGLAGGATAAWWAKENDTEKISVIFTENIAVNFAREVERGAYGYVSSNELKSWIDAKKEMLIVDTNPEGVYNKQHIPGAINLEIQRPELTKLDDKLKNALEKIMGPDKNRVIVFYCGFTECTRSHNGAMWAVKLGYKNVYRHPGGIKAWNEAEYPVEKVK
jgi:thiosulfate/3-mercaptopyruvate sulfurtransferase